MMRTTIAGIPCQIEVTHYEPYDPGNWHEPASGGEIEVEVYDRRGYRAKWLEAKVTEADIDELYRQHTERLQGLRDEARIDAYIDSLMQA